MSQVTAVDPEAEIANRLAQLSLEQKVRLMTGADIWALHPIPQIGLRRLVTSDGPAGVRGETWDERSPSANVPSPTSLAASWDPVAVERMVVGTVVFGAVFDALRRLAQEHHSAKVA